MERTPAVTIGVVTDQTGPGASFTQLEAVKLAVEIMNEALAAKGQPFRFEMAAVDSGSVPERAAQFARELVQDDGAKAIITGSDDEMLAVLADLDYQSDLARNARVPVLCAACFSGRHNNCAVTDSDAARQAALRDRTEFGFRTAGRSSMEAHLIVSNILVTRGTNGDVNGDGAFKIALYRSSRADSATFVDDLRAAQSQLAGPLFEAGKVILEAVLFDGTADPATYQCDPTMAALIDAANSDPFISPTPPDTYRPDAILGDALPAFDACMAKAYRSSGSTIFFLQRTNFRHPMVLEALGPSANGFEGLSPVRLAPTAAGEGFRQAMLNRTGLDPQLLDAHFFDAAMTLMLGTIKGVKDSFSKLNIDTVSGQQIAAGMPRLNEPDGTTVTASTLATGLQIFDAGISSKINYDGASGPVDFLAPVFISPTLCDADRPGSGGGSGGDVVTNYASYRVAGQEFIETQLFDCLGGTPCGN